MVLPAPRGAGQIRGGALRRRLHRRSSTPRPSDRPAARRRAQAARGTLRVAVGRRPLETWLGILNTRWRPQSPEHHSPARNSVRTRCSTVPRRARDRNGGAVAAPILDQRPAASIPNSAMRRRRPAAMAGLRRRREAAGRAAPRSCRSSPGRAPPARRALPRLRGQEPGPGAISSKEGCAVRGQILRPRAGAFAGQVRRMTDARRLTTGAYCAAASSTIGVARTGAAPRAGSLRRS